MLTVVAPLVRRLGLRRVLHFALLVLGLATLLLAATHTSEACSVRELLATPLRRARREGVNANLLPFVDGYVEVEFRDGVAARRNWTQADRLAGVQRSLACAARMLRRFGVSRWWLVGGSLVGYMRHGAPLPHDTDGDFILDESDFDRFIAQVRRLRQFDPPHFLSDVAKAKWGRGARRTVWFCDGHCAFMRNDDDTLVGSVVDVGTGFYSDIWVGNFTGDEFLWWEYDRDHRIPVDRLFPLRNVSYYPLVDMQVPNDIPAYLSRSFDGDYMHYASSEILFALFTRLVSPGLLRVLLLLVAVRVAFVRDLFPTGAYDRYVVVLQLAALAAVFAATLLSECAGYIALASLCIAAAQLVRQPPTRESLILDTPSMLIALLAAVTLRTWAARLVGLPLVLLQSPLFAIDYASFWNGTNALP
jgi:hypothetical protein